MPQPKRGYALGSNPSHHRLMLRNLAESLFEHERIRTTEAKAKALRPYAERLITKAKKGTVHHRRQVLGDIENRAVVHKLFDDIGPRFSERNGGYTRILKLGQRAGDGAPMALIELVEGPAVRTGDASEASRRRRGLRRPRRPSEESPAAAATDEEVADEVTDDRATEPEGADTSDTDETGSGSDLDEGDAGSDEGAVDSDEDAEQN